MLDSFVKPYIEKPATQIGKNLADNNFTSTQISLGGFVIGVLAAFAAGMQAYGIGLLLLIANRLSDMVDDAVADASTRTPFSTYADAITNVVFYGLVVFMFGLGQGQSLGASFVLFSFMAMTATYYASVILGKDTGEQQTAGKVSFAPGALVETSEINIFLFLIFLFPGAFSALAMIFGLMCWVTAFGRIYTTMQSLKIAPPPSAMAADDVLKTETEITEEKDDEPLE